MTAKEEAKKKAIESFGGYCGGGEIEGVWSEGFDDGWDAKQQAIQEIIEYLELGGYPHEAAARLRAIT